MIFWDVFCLFGCFFLLCFKVFWMTVSAGKWVDVVRCFKLILVCQVDQQMHFLSINSQRNSMTEFCDQNYQTLKKWLFMRKSRKFTKPIVWMKALTRLDLTHLLWKRFKEVSLNLKEIIYTENWTELCNKLIVLDELVFNPYFCCSF